MKLKKILSRLDPKTAQAIRDKIERLAQEWDEEADHLAAEAEMPSAATMNDCADRLRKFAGLYD